MVFAAQLGWWHAAIGNPPKPRSEYFDAFYLPEITPAETMPDLWAEVGFCSRAGDGSPVVLSWAEIEAYRSATSCGLGPECWRIIREMSAEFVSAAADTNLLSIAPMERVSND